MSKAKPTKPGTPLPAITPRTAAAANASTDPPATLTFPSLKEHLATLQQLHLHLRTQRNFLQQESSLLTSHHTTLIATNDRTRAHLSNLSSQLERLSEAHRSEIKILRQKEQHMQYEESATRNTIQHEESKQQIETSLSHQSTLTALNTQLYEQTLSIQHANQNDEKMLRELMDSNKKELIKLQENFDRIIDSLHAHYKTRVKDLEESMALREKVEWHEIEERSNRQLLELKSNHEKNYADIKNYYQSITSDNIQLIRELQAEIVEIKNSQDKKEKSIVVLMEQNKQMNVPLLESNKTKQQLELALVNYNKNKNSLSMLKQNYKKKQLQLKHLQAEYTNLNTAFISAHESTQLLLSTPLPASAPQPPAALVAAVSASQQLYDMRRAQLQSVIVASELPHGLVQQLYGKLDELLGGKERVVVGLEYERQRVQKGLEDMRRVMEAKLRAAGVKREKRSEQWVEGRGTQPAGLIVR